MRLATLVNSLFLVGCVCATSWSLSLTPSFCAADDLATINERRDAAFARLDSDGNKRLSEQEFLQRPGDPKELRRDFKLFDFSGDHSISRAEFALLPVFGTAAQRGIMPDPFDGLLGQAIDAMDQAYDGWDKQPDQQMNSTFFAINFAASLATDNRRRLDREIVTQADPNGDHMVTRDEARRFLEIQLGIRWTTGDRLRLANGRTVHFIRFLKADVNSDDLLSKKEFVDSWWKPEAAEEMFTRVDRNGDGEITLTEFAHPEGPNIVDPIADFRKADKDFDALLDAEELKAATPNYRKNLIASSLRAFDDDGDGKLSLAEYRLSMLSNYNYSWGTIPKDKNSDDLLSFEEFVFFSKRDLFQLQRRLYFHRLDTNADKKLSADEFEFKGKPRHTMVLLSLETGKTSEIYRRQEFPTCGSPAISPDGKWIAFDAIPIAGASKARILKMNFDGQNVHNLCDGMMPTWSKDGSQFACSRYEGGSGIWIMNADGTPHKRLSDGWAAQWSPDGKSIAYTNDNSLRVYDVESEQSRIVLSSDDHPFQYIFWNMCWSPDSQRMVFKGRLPNQQQIAIVNMTGEPKLQRHHSSNKQIGGDFAWSPDGKRILFNMFSPETNNSQIYQFDPDSDEPPKLAEGIPTDRSWVSVCFSDDGKQLVLSSPE